MFFATKLTENVSEVHKCALPLSTYVRSVPMMHRFVPIFAIRREVMRAAFFVGCAALLLSACRQEIDAECLDHWKAGAVEPFA